MTIARTSLFLACLVLAGGGLSAAVHAQQIRTIYSPSQLREDHGAMLTRHLRTLSDSPRNLNALVGAGQASLALGDARSALTFFGRAEEVAPRDQRIASGMGACFALLEQPALALQYFGQAGNLTGDARAYVAHRGLAYDLVGSSALAQADYRTALRDRDEWAVRERLALSLAIGGDQAGALQSIEPQLRRSDRAAWRVRAFILALGGDAAGATEAARAVVPQSAAQLQPFFARLPSLTAAEKAMAVHFGHMPAPGARYAQQAYQAPAPRQTFAAAPRTSTPLPPPANRAPASSSSPPSPQQPAPRPLNSWPAAATLTQRTTPQPMMPQPTTPQRPTTQPTTSQPIAATALPPSAIRPSEPVRASPTVSEPSVPVRSASAPAAAPAIAAAKPDPAPAKPAERVPFGRPSGPIDQAPSRFADIAELLKVLPDPPRDDAKPPAKTPAKAADPKPKAATPKPAAAKPAAAKPKEPARIWVQVAGGADTASLPREYSRLRTKAPNLFKDRAPWTTPLKATNRLLVGPFKTEKDAQSFVNDLTKAGLSGFSWTSEDGQVVAKLAAG